MSNPIKHSESSNANPIIGKDVIVRANVAGVHFGTVSHFDPATQTITLEHAHRLWRFYTRDTTGSISDVAAHGLKGPVNQHHIGAQLPSVVIVNPPGLEIAVCAPKVRATIEEAAAK